MTATQVTDFEALRPHLMAVAYRVTGTVADAEDIVQEAWLRWDKQDNAITDLRAWLTTVVSRLGLDRLRSAAHRRETYTGNWLPEPVVTGFDGADPLSAVVAREDARFAAMVVLERLSPDQRIAFVLHDGFSMPFSEVAEVLGTNEPAARQLASRARKAVAGQAPPKPDPSHNEVVGKLMAAMAAGDLESVVALLHPDVTMTGDSNGKAPTAINVIHGADKVARFFFGLANRYGPAMFTSYQLGLVNGELGGYTVGVPASGGYREMMPRIMAMTVRDGKVCALWDVANPEKFTGSPLSSRRNA
ncbi:sigma-70 family RNA polymerase sigma factor [Mycobacterium montefiorense]|uniref:RNA polymerase sigma factor SigJ n=1 Tax=Mycobacterium montefiorense TaxID=154654 RepID=A0AA37PN68_9MYCO|nr:sigma-70 family RNA polymerase sigma factor [Mycobacterium montefiorense]GBG37111.1 RNA polymerase sigma factor SigJ [Mycobacterium montefiorense]GKU36856.1 RNA polymerase sigma factor SigJ [Mycobacterium montefiorense]GKU42865.1 RNA polymerase sigma factor SigJ [Mycobacterium montefiorense]GKU48445.1 RNA polymerase sigma factor SigJ [Mycobacterium montefiorense]GKU50916.1 RNA polymerase sigma factor SigJ [Mycobacterium montefiorense]